MMYPELQRLGKYLGSARIHTYSYYSRCLTTALPLLVFYYETVQETQVVPIESESDYNAWRKRFTDAISISWWAVPGDWFSNVHKTEPVDCTNSSINPIL